MKTRSRILGFKDFSAGLVTMAPGEVTNGLIGATDLYADPSGRGLRLMDGGADQNVTWSGATAGTTAEFVEILDWQTESGDCLARGQDKIWLFTPASSSTDITGALSLANPAYSSHMVAGTSGGISSPAVGVFSNEQWTWPAFGDAVDWVATTGTLPVTGKPICWTNNRMYGVSASDLSTLVWSDILDADSWPTDNFVTLGTGDGEIISGIVALGPYLLVFKFNSIYVIYDLDTGANRLLSNTVGTLDWRTCVSSPHGVFFRGSDGIMYQTDGTSLQPISRPIRTAVDDTHANAAVGRGSVGFYHDDWYEFSLWTGTTWTRHLRYHIPTKTWWDQSLHATNGVAPASYMITKNKTGLYYALYPDNGTSKPALVRQMFDPTSYAGLSPSVQLPYVNLGGPMPRARVRGVTARTGFSGSHTFTFYDSDGTELWSRSATASDNQARVRGLGPDGLTRGGSLKIDFPTPTAIGTATTGVLDSVEFEYSSRAD